MLQTRSYMERRFVTNEYGEITGLEPVFVKEEMVYRDGNITTPFGYDTNAQTEADVQKKLDEYPSFLSRLFGSMVSYFSRRIWRCRDNVR